MLLFNTEPNPKIMPFVPLPNNVRCSKMYPANALLGPPDVVFRVLSADEAKRGPSRFKIPQSSAAKELEI